MSRLTLDCFEMQSGVQRAASSRAVCDRETPAEVGIKTQLKPETLAVVLSEPGARIIIQG